jgi:predicted aldo/keto reductase-like oxidoreductase
VPHAKPLEALDEFGRAKGFRGVTRLHDRGDCERAFIGCARDYSATADGTTAAWHAPMSSEAYKEYIARRPLVLAALASLTTSACGDDKPKEGAQNLPSPATTAGEMPRRKLGKTGVEVSAVGLGGSHIGQVKDEAEAIRIMHAAIERGMTFFDNCWDYNEGKSEEWMGKALKDGKREKVFLMTKLDGRTKQSAKGQLEQSLQRLGTDMIDLVQIHEVIHASDPARCFEPGGAIEAYVEAKKEGKLRFIGFTGHKHPDIHLSMLDAADKAGFAFDTVQMPLNVMDAHYESFEHKVLPRLVENNIGVLGMKAIGSGILLESKAVTAVECLQYALSLPTSVVITGCDSMGILEQAIATAVGFKPLSAEQRAQLLARTEQAAKDGQYEKFKTSEKFDGTVKNPKWLEKAEL